MENITDRFIVLYNYILENKIVKNAAKFSEEIGIRPSQMSDILNGRTEVGLKPVQGVIKKYSAVNANWLLNGIGDMLTKTPSTEAEGGKDEEEISLNDLLDVDLMNAARLQVVEETLAEISAKLLGKDLNAVSEEMYRRRSAILKAYSEGDK